MDRFKDLLWFNKAKNRIVTVIGIGGIGSWLVLLLARAGFKTVIYDNDIVDNTNMSGQLFMNTDIHEPKTVAISRIVSMFRGTNVFMKFNSKFTDKSVKDNIYPITIVGTDSMISRKDIFYAWKSKYLMNEYVSKDILFVDGRLLAEQFEIFCITNKKQASKYENEFLYSDEEVPKVSCTAKQTSHYAAMIAGNIVRFVTNKILIEQDIPADLPFKYNFNGVVPKVIDKQNKI